jgi:hypothetical protein
MKLIRVGVDLAKDVFQLHGVDHSEKTVWRRTLVRGDWIRELLEGLSRVARSEWKHVAAHTTGEDAAGTGIYCEINRSAVC